MSVKRDVADHLRRFGELGVVGVSRDPAWRAREGDSQASGPRPQAPSDPAADDGADPVLGPRPLALAEPAADATPPSPALGAEGPDADEARAQGPGPGAGALSELRDFIGDCTRCKLHALGRQQVVFGVGSPQANLMFVGEAPGADEDRLGEPFVGRAGQLLTKMIEAIDLRREDVYIANVIKCRPPGNRNPEADEIATCQPFLFRQIDLVQPKVIVALGTFAAHTLLQTDAPISRLRGHVHLLRGAHLVPTFHPAFLLRSPDRKRDAWADLQKVRELLRSDHL